jgi:glucose/arabinose dehydrogenase
MKRAWRTFVIVFSLLLIPIVAAALSYMPPGGTPLDVLRGNVGVAYEIAQLKVGAPSTTIGVEVVARDFRQPVYVTSPPGDARLFVVDQPGQIWIIEGSSRLPTPFLDIGDRVTFGGEQGLLGLAFHPGYASNGRFFLNYTDRSGNSEIAEFRVSADRNVATPQAVQTLLNIPDRAPNHNGGWLDFGPDGLLYIATGDGGGAGDPFRNGQDRSSLLAKILRLDVDGAAPYAIPPGNPWANGGGAPEGFVYGLRNPWRVSFDGDRIYIADVGQGEWEEISVITTASGGANLGWSVMEGAHCFRARSCQNEGMVFPVYEFSHAGGACSVTGGYVYRGSAIPALAGHYFFGDYCAGFVRSFRYEPASGVTALTDWTAQLGDLGQITSFGKDSAGELYIVAADGRIMKIVPR